MSKLLCKYVTNLWSITCLLSILIISGCVTTPTTHVAGAPASDTGLHTFEATNISDIEFQFRAPDGSHLTARVSYLVSKNLTREPELLRQIQTFSKPETTLLLIFLQHAAWQYVNYGIVTKYVQINLSGDTDMPGKKWFFSDADNTVFGAHTLELVQKETRIEILPTHGNPETEWVPLTPDSYPVWWTQVDSRLQLSELFDDSDAI